jgi:hypothetical protein
MPFVIPLDKFKINLNKIDDFVESNIPLKSPLKTLGWAEWLLVSCIHPCTELPKIGNSISKVE